MDTSSNQSANQLSNETIHKINNMIWEEKNIYLKQKHGAFFSKVNVSKRYGNYVFKGINSKNKMKEFLEINTDYKVCAQILDYNGFRQFIPFTSWTDCWNKYSKTAWRKRYIYELICSDKPCKPYFDIEWKVNTIDIKPNILILNLIDDIILIFQNRYQKTITYDDFFITEACSDEKFSFHIIITTKNPTLVFNTNRKRCNNSAWDLFQALKDKYSNIIDESVYSLDREFRTIYSTKYDEYRLLRPITVNELKTTYKAKYVNKTSDFISNYLDYFITHYENIEFINTPPYENIIVKKSHLDKKYNAKETDDFIVLRILELLQTVHPTAIYSGRVNTTGYRFDYTDRNEPCYTGRSHKKNGFGVYLNNNTGYFYMYCFSAHCSALFKLGHMYDDVTWHIGAKIIEQPFIELVDFMKIQPSIEKKNVESTVFLADFVNKKGIAAIKSPMGTGKTKTLINLINEHFKDKRIMYISFRQSLSNNIEGTLPGFHNYMNKCSNMYEKDKIIIQLDSLHKLKKNDGVHIKYDLIILDEIESLLFHLSSTVMKCRMDVCELLQNYIKCADWVLALDADFNQRAFDFLTSVKNKPRILINDIKPKVIRHFVLTSNYYLNVSRLIEDLKTNKKIVIICLSIGDANEIYRKLDAFNVVLHTSKEDDSKKTKLKDVNSFWTQYQAVIFTGVVDAGIDFNVQGYFDNMYCFICKGCNSPRSFLQMTGRIRHLNNNVIKVAYPKNMNVVNDFHIPSLLEMEEFLVNQNLDICRKKYIEDVDGFKIIPQKNIFSKIFAYNRLEIYTAFVNFLSILKESIIEKGYTYAYDKNIPNDNNDITISDNVTTINDNVSSKSSVTNENENVVILMKNEMAPSSKQSSKKIFEFEDFLEAPDINANELLVLEDNVNNNIASKFDKLAIKKYYFKRKLKVDHPINNDLDPEILKLFLKWYDKEYVLDNALCALGKKSYDDTNDPYFKNIGNKIKYLNKFLNVFGFDSLLDNKMVELDEILRTKMKNSGLLTNKNYSTMMKTFEKRERAKDCENFRESTFINITDSILNEFGFKIDNNIEKKRNKEIKNKFDRKYTYFLNESMPFLIDVINKY